MEMRKRGFGLMMKTRLGLCGEIAIAAMAVMWYAFERI